MAMIQFHQETEDELISKFNKSVFINCPFDNEYYPILRPLLFTILYLGYIPRIALEDSDCGQPRLEKLVKLISQSRYSIHDLSRVQSSKKNEFYRLNMPFELGIDYGCRCFANNNHSSKRFLILEKENYRYMKALSDINGLDIKPHKNDPQEIVKSVRNWFVETVRIKNVKSPTMIWYNFTDFYSSFYDLKTAEGFTNEEIDFMPIPELIDNMVNWLERN